MYLVTCFLLTTTRYFMKKFITFRIMKGLLNFMLITQEKQAIEGHCQTRKKYEIPPEGLLDISPLFRFFEELKYQTSKHIWTPL
ncbi:hypothetical protein Scep_026528 [Stephania cephalantha]|uniref:Uncharacterized protein n=1 Tax=Stephania cephalantha TaxID=152367 RepID=A0AAP0EKQ2_9MAGN